METTIAGEIVVGVQRDFSMRYLTMRIRFRVRWSALRRKDNTILFMVFAAGGRPEAQPRLNAFFEHFESE